MKNKMQDVRDHLVAMLEALGDTDTDKDATAQVIERAKATALVAGTYIAAVKTELDAIVVFEKTGLISAAIEAPPKQPTTRSLPYGGRNA